MATKVFTSADITFTSASGIDAGWITAAAAWTLTANVNGDSGTVSNTPGSAGQLNVVGSLVDDASIPADIRVISIQVEFDWHVVNVGGGALGPHDNSILFQVSNIAGGADTQLANSDTTGHYDFTLVKPRTQAAITTRAEMFAAGYGFRFEPPQRSGANTSRVVVTNYILTVVYINTGVGSWRLQTTALANATGAVDLVTFAPNVAQITGPSTSGTVDAPIEDTAGAFIFLDGDATAVDIAGLPSGFTTESFFTVRVVLGPQFVGDTADAALAPLIAISTTYPTNSDQDEFTFTGMTLPELTAMLGQVVLVTLTTGTDPFVGNLRLLVESFATWDPLFTIGIWGTYTVTTPEVISVNPPRGSINGGQAVTIHGHGFTGAPGALFGGVAVTSFVVVDDDTATAVTPAHLSGLVDVEVTGVGTGVGLYTYVVETRIVPPMPTRTPIAQGRPQRG